MRILVPPPRLHLQLYIPFYRNLLKKRQRWVRFVSCSKKSEAGRDRDRSFEQISSHLLYHYTRCLSFGVAKLPHAEEFGG